MDDFDEFEPGHDASRRYWILLCLSLIAALAVGTVGGYALRQGIWPLPDSARDYLPQFVAGWLPSPEAASLTRSPVDLNGYSFELVDAKARRGDAIVSIRLLHKRNDSPISDAVIFARRLDMAPEGMPTMTADLKPMSTTEPGTYRFKTNLTMQGKWQLSLAAKVQGENGTIQNKLVLEATP
ncbi:MAG: FixH family protein [Rhizobiales bacterium]|nr:FixH family protein [Hyphomicrobiales bacterium]